MNALPREIRPALPDALCSVDGCQRTRHSMGFCSMHAKRFKRHGDPLGGRTFDGEPAAWLEKHLRYEGDECVPWPFAKCSNGYPQIVVDRKRKYVTRVICERAYGQPLSPDHQAAHSCGNGHLSCITKRHLRWASPVENNGDKVAHGTFVRGSQQNGAKLTEDDVRTIRMLHNEKTQTEIASLYGVSPSTISEIIAGKRWGWLK